MADAPAEKLGRNDPCHCGSGKKYKKCHLQKDEEKERVALAKQAKTHAAPDSAAPTPEEKKPRTGPGIPGKKPEVGFRKFIERFGFKSAMPRRTGGS